MFVTSQGSPLTRFRRAIRGQSVLMAELSAREAGRLPLEDALALVALYAATDDEKFDRAAVRWLVRVVEERRLSLGDMQLAAAAAATLREQPDRALRILRELSALGTRT